MNAAHLSIDALQPNIDAYITVDRIRRYLHAIADMPAPSTAASAFRTPLLRKLLSDDRAFEDRRLHLLDDFERTGSTVLLTGTLDAHKPIWYFAHLDTISYLVQPRDGNRYPLVPFCYHLIGNGERHARAYRYDPASSRYRLAAIGHLMSEQGTPFFRPDEPSATLRIGDRIVLSAAYREDSATGGIVGNIDNAGAVAALAVAAPVLARVGVEAMLAFPDEEEGPPGAGSQVMGRGGTRIVNLLSTPELAIIADVQQAGGDPHADSRGGVENSTRLGLGAVLAEFSSLARGAVTPPHLYAEAQQMIDRLAPLGVRIQESNNAYSSRSDDVSVLLKTPNILLLGFPGFNRHFDLGEPRANLHDVVSLSKALVYFSAIRPLYQEVQSRLFRVGT